MTGHLPYDANLARHEEMRTRADAYRRARPSPSRGVDPQIHVDSEQTIAIRRAGEADRVALERLGALDGGGLRLGDVLVAEVGGEVQAAMHVASGATVADPFRPTGDLIDLLGLRATRLRQTSVVVGRPGLRARLRSLSRAA